ncbi:MAG: hypothetical protein KDD89_04160, partial [Anaerolineales bacterium]|nr:hypothetical protein [Anaerolineales bacterium]
MRDLLETILSLPNGARFYRVDLHNHTPADPHFHCLDFNTNNEEECRALAREYVRFAHETQRLDIIGITDHNETGWLGYIQEAAEALYPGKLIVLPGVELGANEGKRQVHLLALFNPGTRPSDIDHFISSLGLLPHGRFHPGAKPSPRLTPLSLRDLTQRIATTEDGLPGLPIAAHATRKNGLLHELEGEGRVIAYEDPHLVALEIPARRQDLSNFVQRLVNGEEAHYSYKSIACLNSSDGRGLGQVHEKGRLSVGEKATRIKLSTFSIDALRHAFIDYDSRIRLEGEKAATAAPRLLGLIIQDGFLAGDPDGATPLQIHFNPNLNTIIGGRGAGKSSLLEALRFVFDLPARSDDTQTQTSQVVAATLPPGAKVTAFYELADGTRYAVSRRAGQAPRVADVETGELVAVEPRHLLPGRVPLEVYGQKEVYEIAINPTFQLNLIDSYIADELREVAQEETAVLRALDSNAHTILRLEDELAEAEQALLALPALKLELERLERDTAGQQLAEKKRFEQERHALEALHTAVDERLNWLNTAVPDFANPSPHAFPQQSALLTQLDTHIQRVWQQLHTDFRAIWAQGTAERDAWQARYDANETAYQHLLDKHGQALSIERYFDQQQKYQQLQQLAESQQQRRTQLAQVRQARQTLLARLRTLRQETIFALRQQKAAALTQALQGNVRLTLTAEGHTAVYADYLRQLFKGHRITQKVIDTIVEAHTSPMALVQAIHAERTAVLPDATPLETHYGLTPAYRERLADLPDS